MWLPHSCLLGGPQVGGNATPPLHSQGFPKTKGDKIRSGSLTPAFSGAHKWAEMLRHPYILGDPENKGGLNQKGVLYPCLLGSPKKGGNATSPLHFGGP